MKKMLFIFAITIAGMAAFADCSNCGSDAKPKLILKCAKCNRTFCDECIAEFPGWHSLFPDLANEGVVRCKCGASGRLHAHLGEIRLVTCTGRIRLMRWIQSE